MVLPRHYCISQAIQAGAGNLQLLGTYASQMSGLDPCTWLRFLYLVEILALQ